MAFAGNLRTLPLPDVFQTLNNIKATGVLRLRSQAGSRDVVFNQGEIIGVGFLDKQGREDIELRLSLLGVEADAGQRLQGVTWYWTAMQARERANRAELDELVHEQAREQLHNLFAWNTAEFNFDESGPGKIEANELVARSLERPLSIDTATILLEAARQQDEWADLRARIRDETGAAAMGSSPALGVQQSALEAVEKSEKVEAPQPSESDYHLYLNGEWQGPYPRSRIVGMVQTGEVPVETWSYDQRTQDRKTLDQLLGNEAKRIRPEDLDALRQAVKAAEGRLAEERAGRAADLAELRGLASEVLRLARDCELDDPAIEAVVARLNEVVGGDDPSIVALASETVVVALVRHLRDLAGRDLAAARERADTLARRIGELEAGNRALEGQLGEAERRSEAERANAESLRERLAAAADDAARLDQELERSKRDNSRVSTARIAAIRTPEDAAAASAERAADQLRELGRMRAEHARLLNEVASLQARLDEDRARHEAELEASRALHGSLEERPQPPTESIAREGGGAEPRVTALQAEVDRLRALLAEATRNATGDEAQRALAARDRAAAERDEARGDTERLRRDLHQARAEAARTVELARAHEQIEARVTVAEGRAVSAEARANTAGERAERAERELAELRTRLAQAEEERRAHERTAYEATRQNTELQVRLRELAARLDEGEQRLAELGDLSTQLAEARRRAADLEEEGARIRHGLAAVRGQTTDKLERAKRRVVELRARLREAKRDRNAPVPWSSPMTAAFSAAPAMQQAAVPWPSPATAGYAQGAPPAGWTEPSQAGPALAPHALPNATLRTTSGTFVPMPMPDDSSAGRRAVRAPAQGEALPTPDLSRRPRAWRWGLAAAGVVLAGAWAWSSAAAAVPIIDAVVNGQMVEVTAPISGHLVISEKGVVGSLVRTGDVLGTIRNQEIDPSQRDRLANSRSANENRLRSTEESLRRAQLEHDLVARELASQPLAVVPGAAPDPRLRLRDEIAIRLLELGIVRDDLRLRQAELEAELAREQRRLDEQRAQQVVASRNGLVYRVSNELNLAAGKVAFVIIDEASIVLDGAIPADHRLQARENVEVRLGGTVFTARMLESDAYSLRDLARDIAVPNGHRRVLLQADSGAIQLAHQFGATARVAVTGNQPGPLSLFALKLRF
jgi:hypothetical protein